jgi:hypothetical protein
MFAEAFDALGGHRIEESTEPLIHKNSTPLVLLLPLNPLLPHATTSLRNPSPSISEFFLPSKRSHSCLQDLHFRPKLLRILDVSACYSLAKPKLLLKLGL